MKRVAADNETLQYLGIEIYDDFYKRNLLRDLIARKAGLGVRKQVTIVEPGQRFPAPVDRAAEKVRQLFGFVPNFVSEKTYTPGENSDAFLWHLDPNELQAAYVISTLRGTATLGVRFGHMIVEIVCGPNRTVVMPPGVLHSVTTPEGEERDIIFFSHHHVPPEGYEEWPRLSFEYFGPMNDYFELTGGTKLHPPLRID